ncbi:hypothetical protein NRK68_10180 [Streptomyces yangpuensis]|uniref:Uncharacterized protein n=1 Tax=Streptomyces yangpuensis TaxID=1648182 RepID=A0ABY5PVK8_9ACTN|nr:hypothetical protein [Streptomyces yangpuensis]UUY47553.1 hypothetical protein NRK68_10180 [Streptomyces yangpuensis]
MPSGHAQHMQHMQQETARTRPTGPTGPRPLAPIPFDVEAVFPELTGTAREVTLVYPRAGEPGPGDSSIGGPLLWPADEPWPMCAEPDHYKPLGAPVGPEPVAMVPVAQLYARDVPGLAASAGCTSSSAAPARTPRTPTATTAEPGPPRSVPGPR